jgi:hypothetical protein
MLSVWHVVRCMINVVGVFLFPIVVFIPPFHASVVHFLLFCVRTAKVFTYSR